MARQISLNEDSINEVGKRLNEQSTKVEDTSKKMSTDYSGLTSHGMLNETVSDMSKNFASLQNVIAGTATAFVKHGNEMFNYDRSNAAEINDLYVPQDFVKENSIQINQYNASILSKIDGKSVNEGQASEEQKYDDSTVVTAEKLTDISGNQTEEQKLDETTVLGNTLLGNISGNQTEEQRYNDNVSIQSENLANISGNQTEKQEYNDNVSVQSENLVNISGNQTEKQEYNDNTVLGNTVLGNINNNNSNQIQEQKFDDTMIVGNTLLGNINSSEEEKQKEVENINNYENVVLQSSETKKDE